MGKGKKKEKYVILWNDDNYSKNFLSKFNHLKVITNKNELHDLITNCNLNSTFFIVLAELTWDRNYYSQLYGIHITCELRTKNIKNPIAITSFIPKKIILNYTLLPKFPHYHPYIELPFDFNQKNLEEIFKNSKFVQDNDPIYNNIYRDPVSQIIYLITHGEGLGPLYKHGILNPDKCIIDVQLLDNIIVSAGLTNLLDLTHCLRNYINNENASNSRKVLEKILEDLKKQK